MKEMTMGTNNSLTLLHGGKVTEDNEDESKQLIDIVSPSKLETYNREIVIHKKVNSRQYRQ